MKPRLRGEPVAVALSLAAAAVGLAVFWGWLLENPALTRLFLPGPTVKTNTAIALTCGGAASALLAGAGRRRWAAGLGLLLAAVVAAIGLLTFAEHALQRDFGIDQLIATENPGAFATASPNRMGPPAALTFALIGASLLLGRIRRSYRIAHACAVLGCGVPVLGLLGYAYGVGELYTVARLTGIALSTSIALVALSAAVAAGGPRVGLTALLVRHDEVGAFARRLVPAAVLLPLALGWAMSALLHAGVVNEPLAIAMMALGLVAGLLAVVWRTGKRLSFALDARLQAERALSASEQSLRESDRQKTDFLATLSHELRNPLAPIRFAIDVMETSTEAAQHARHVLRRQVRHLSRLVDDLLDLTRITRSKLHLDLRPVELRAVVNEAVDATAAELAAQGHQLTVSLPPGQVWLRADADRLVQVLVNLLTNAGRYTPAGGRIAIEALVEGPEIGIVVRDNGRGIAAEDLHRIFDDFVQVGATKHGGLGIGLALVKGLVALHEGRIEASSAGHDQGSTFTVYLKRDYAPQPEPWSAPETAHCSAQRFLVVDDNVDAANTLRDLLASRGHKAAVAYDGVSALRTAAVVRPTVALLDIGLPGMSGYEVARHLRRDPELSAVFLVAITGWGQDDDKRQALEAGFDAHLTKPADPEHILQIVAAALDAAHGAAGPT